MLKSQYLSASRHGIFYFRFSIPQTLHPERKQTSIRVSLNTRCPRQALQLSRMLSYAGDHILQSTGTQGMKHQQIRDVLHEHFKGLLEKHRERATNKGKLPDLDRQSFEKKKRDAADTLENYEYGSLDVDTALVNLTERYSMPILPETPLFDSFRTEFLKAFRDYCTTVLKEDDALESYDFSRAAHKPSTTKERKLVSIAEQYCEEKLRLKQWTPNSANGYRAQFALLLRMLGADASLHISSDVANDVKDKLLRLPKNMSKIAEYSGMTIDDITALKLPDSERLSASSVAKHMRTYSTFYDWAVQKKHTSENNFSAYVDDVKKAIIPRAQFSAEQTSRILAISNASKKPHQKWGVLIAFYTGARLNEIAQLETTDIKQLDGVWCFHFTDEGEDKRLKNQSSKRSVPIHSQLIAAGFLDYVKAAGKGRLFSALTFHPKDGYGRNLGRWFNASLLRKQLEIASPTLVFHSIRHTVAQQLRNNKVQEATLKDILGHSHTGVTMTTYANNLDKTVMQEAIETLHY